MMSEISSYLEKKYCKHPECERITQYFECLWAQYQRFSDRNFLKEFCSGDEDKFIERFWEMYLACDFLDKGIQIVPSSDGPDIKIQSNDRVIWVEAIVAGIGVGANRLPSEYLNPDQNNTARIYDVPHEQILLRWTTAIDEKIEKFGHYRKTELVGPKDLCLIAVNSCRLEHHGFDGISRFPNAVEATYGVGPEAVCIDQETAEPIGAMITFRPSIANANDSPVQTNIFLDPNYSQISGLLAAHKHPVRACFGDGDDLISIRSFVADNEVPSGFFPVSKEYWADKVEENKEEQKFRICCRQG